MLTLSERWFTTHTSVSVRAATATGSMPTGTETEWVRPPPAPTSKTSSWLSGMLRAKSFVPSGESASGRTGPLSKVMKLGWPAAVEASSKKAAAHRKRLTRRIGRTSMGGPSQVLAYSRGIGRTASITQY